MKYHQDARISQGDDKTLQVTTSNPGAVVTAGMSARYCVSLSPLGEKVITKTNLLITPAIPNILIAVNLSSDDTESLFPGNYYHEITVTMAGGADVTVMSGTLRIDPSANMALPPLT